MYVSVDVKIYDFTDRHCMNKPISNLITSANLKVRVRKLPFCCCSTIVVIMWWEPRISVEYLDYTF